jgi:hypothetical protein
MVGVTLTEAVRAAVAGVTDVDRRPLAELAILLAGRLDAGESAGPVARELRATLAALQNGGDRDDVDRLLAEMGD